jgi:DNA-binding MarR family transcriptional regulator
MVYEKSSGADFGILLGLAFQTFSDQLSAELLTLGYDDIGSSYGYVFRALDGGALHLTELASRLGITDQGVVKIINEMEKRRYVERKLDPDDGRAKLLTLAPRGRALLAKVRRFHAAYERHLSQTLGSTEVATARRVLEALVAASGTDAAHARLRAL